MKKQTSVLPIWAFVVASTLWGINTPLIKLGVESIPVPIFMSIRFLAASLVLLPFAIRTWKPLRRKDFYLLVLSSIIANSFGSLALNIGLTKTSSINAAVIGLLSPLLLCMLSIEFLKERMRLKTFVGILIALTGSLIIIGRLWDAGTATGVEALTGNLFIVISVFCSVSGTLIVKPLLKKTSSYQVTFMGLFCGIIPVALFALTKLPSWHFQQTTGRSLLALLGSTVGILFANFLFFYALHYKKVQNASIYQYINPVATIIAAWFLLAERPSPKFIVGTALVFVGIYVAEIAPSHKHWLGRVF